jgi:hypothetical protein
MVGGMAGSLLGGSKISPVGMALAGLGGMAGEAWKQVADSLRGDFSEVPETALGRLQKIGRVGAEQAGLEGAGRFVGALAQPVAKTLYGLALRPSKALMRDAGGGKLLPGLKRILDQGYGDAVMPSALGVNKAQRLVRKSTDEATQIAAASPITVKTDRVLRRASDDQGRRMGAELATAGIAPKSDAVAEQIGRLAGANADDLSMGQLLAIRRGAEDVAAPVFKAAKMPGGGGRVPPGSEASVARSIAGAARQTLDDVLGPAFQQVNARTQTRMAVKQAVDDAASRPNMLTNLLSGAVGVAGGGGDPVESVKRAMMMRALFSPSVLGGAALAVGRAPYANIFRTVADQDALLALLSGERDE